VLLKQGGNPSEIRMWNELLSKSGWQIIQRRLAVINDLDVNFSEVFRDLFGEGVDLRLRYVSTFGGVESEQQVFKILEKHLDKELRFKRPQIGVHLDDIEILMGGRAIKEFGSQGQIRAATLALTFATAQNLYRSLHQAPVLILDDVDSELDENRKSSLLRVIRATGWQVFVTSTNFLLADDAQLKGGDVLLL